MFMYSHTNFILEDVYGFINEVIKIFFIYDDFISDDNITVIIFVSSNEHDIILFKSTS